MQYSKLSDEILTKKILSHLKELSRDENLENKSRQDLEDLCTSLALECKNEKNRIKEKMALEAEQNRIEEENEKDERRKEKEAKEQEILENSIVDPSLLYRTKSRFFNLAVPSDGDPDGLAPISSPPFFENIKDQFENELGNYKIYSALYELEDMTGQEEYKIKNRNKCFASMVENDYLKYFFVCFRILKNLETGKIIYQSYWISNMKKGPSEIFEEFNFSENTENFIDKFMKGFCEEGFEILDEIYVR
uniref:Uncharacterized protein n=1 Tax=viral metagenome TaxID=1070528 RepID=A0A6C0AD54_9ZZZZ